jgi:hypothetical protein
MANGLQVAAVALCGMDVDWLDFIVSDGVWCLVNDCTNTIQRRLLRRTAASGFSARPLGTGRIGRLDILHDSNENSKTKPKGFIEI